MLPIEVAMLNRTAIQCLAKIATASGITTVILRINSIYILKAGLRKQHRRIIKNSKYSIFYKNNPSGSHYKSQNL